MDELGDVLPGVYNDVKGHINIYAWVDNGETTFKAHMNRDSLQELLQYDLDELSKQSIARIHWVLDRLIGKRAHCVFSRFWHASEMEEYIHIDMVAEEFITVEQMDHLVQQLNLTGLKSKSLLDNQTSPQFDPSRKRIQSNLEKKKLMGQQGSLKKNKTETSAQSPPLHHPLNELFIQTNPEPSTRVFKKWQSSSAVNSTSSSMFSDICQVQEATHSTNLSMSRTATSPTPFRNVTNNRKQKWLSRVNSSNKVINEQSNSTNHGPSLTRSQSCSHLTTPTKR